MTGRMISRNVKIGDQRTSLRLEESVWEALDDICLREGITCHELCTRIEAVRHGSNRTAAVRAVIVMYYRLIAGSAGGGGLHHANRNRDGSPVLDRTLRRAFGGLG